MVMKGSKTAGIAIAGALAVGMIVGAGLLYANRDAFFKAATRLAARALRTAALRATERTLAAAIDFLAAATAFLAAALAAGVCKLWQKQNTSIRCKLG